jgi:regulator of PEP synthase PpsR (kinase-PPPase family)
MKMKLKSRSRADYDGRSTAHRGESKKIVIISDGTGKTAKRLLDAVLAQYSTDGAGYTLADTYQKIRDRKSFDKILQNIDKSYLVIFSIIEEDLGKYFHRRLSKKGIMNINVLEPMIGVMSKFLGVHPDYRPGILQVIDDSYYKKIDAIGFTVEHDDGRGQHIDEAEIVLVGLSRTCKTPIAMYLACNFGIRLANIPVIANEVMKQRLLGRLASVPKQKIIGLLMQADVLARIREERSLYLTGRVGAQENIQEYYDARIIRQELVFCRQLFDQQGWQIVDVTRRAIEEVSLEVLARAEAVNNGVQPK